MPNRDKQADNRDTRADARDSRADARDTEADARDVRHTASNQEQARLAGQYLDERTARRTITDAILSGHEADEAADLDAHKHNRRRKTPYDFLRDSGSIAGALVAMVGLGAWVLDALPIAKASDVKVIQKRLDAVELNLGGINVGQKEMQELQLMDRISVLEEKISKARPDDVLDLKRQSNEAGQKLTQIRVDLQAARLAPH